MAGKRIFRSCWRRLLPSRSFNAKGTEDLTAESAEEERIFEKPDIGKMSNFFFVLTIAGDDANHSGVITQASTLASTPEWFFQRALQHQCLSSLQTLRDAPGDLIEMRGIMREVQMVGGHGKHRAQAESGDPLLV